MNNEFTNERLKSGTTQFCHMLKYPSLYKSRSSSRKQLLPITNKLRKPQCHREKQVVVYLVPCPHFLHQVTY